MRAKKFPSNGSAETTVKAIRRATRRRYAAQEKIRIVLVGLRGEKSIAELCRRERVNQNLYYRWSKEFLEAGKKRLAGDTKREVTSDDVQALRAQAVQLKELLAEVMLENQLHAPLLRIGIDREPASEGPGPHCMSGLHRAAGGRSVSTSEHARQSAPANRLHVPEGHRLAVVVSVHGA